MKLLDQTFASPAENLAADEALLDAAETGAIGETLRFWESPTHFVVVGYANKVATEVNVIESEAAGVPILRRCSGGGTVVQGLGCLNYALVLKIEPDNAMQNISLANQFIMGRNRTAIQTLLQRPVRIQGHTDLTLGGLKFSGNSQRRRKNYLLFHGTFLLNMDLALVKRVLRFPSYQPDYRADRSHDSFLTQLGVSAENVKAAIASAWSASEVLTGFSAEPVAKLAQERYALQEWSFRF